MAKNICHKKEEWSNMAERIRAVEVTQGETNKKLDKLDGKFDKFIDSVDRKYATKEEVASLSDKFTIINLGQDKRIELQEHDIIWNKDKILKLIKELSFVTAVAAILAKQFGVI